MSNTKENKTLKSLPFLLAFFLFLRGLFLSSREHIGLENFYTLTFNITYENAIFLCLLLAFAVLTGLVLSSLNKKFGGKAVYLSVLLVAEPLVFAKQDDTMVLFIISLALLFILNALREKPVVPNEITLIVFLLASTILFENAIFLFVLPALILYFIGDGEGVLKSRKKIVMLLLSVVSVSGGISLNDYLVSNYSAFDGFIKKYSFFEQVYFKHIPYENVFLFIFALPIFAFGCYFLVEYVKECASSGKNRAAYVAVGMVAAAYLLMIVGFILRGSEAFYTINYIMPFAIFALVAAKKPKAEKALEKVNSFVSKHTLLLVSAAVILSFLATVIFYEGVDNLAGFMLNI